MLQPEYIIAYDHGTGAIKVALVDLEGNLIDYAVESYPLYAPQALLAEQNPENYWEAACRGTRKVLNRSGADPRKARGIVFDTIWKSLILLDTDIRLMGRSIIWMDARADKEARELNRHFRRNLFQASDYWPKLLWLRRNMPNMYDRAYKIVGVNTYLGFKATGNLCNNLTDSFVSSPHEDFKALYDEFLSYGDISKDKFVDWVDCSSQIGVLQQNAAEMMNLVPGIPVFAGSCDIPAIAIGSGSAAPGKVHAYFGTSGWICAMHKHTGKDLYVIPIDRSHDLTLKGTICCLALNWTIQQLYRKEQEELGDQIFSHIEQELKDIPFGSGNVLAMPFLFGGRKPDFSSKARAGFFNISSQHDRRHMLNALLESICYIMRMNAKLLAESTGITSCDTINAVGGGACISHWMQILSNVMNARVQVPAQPRHAGTIGVAYHALIGLGYFDSLAQASENIHLEHTYLPDPSAHSRYLELFEQFQRIYPAMKELYFALN